MLEVGVLHFTHDTSPSLFWVEEVAVVVDVGGVKVIWAAFGRIEGEIEGLYCVGFPVGEFTSGKDFLRCYLAYIGIRLLLEIVFDVTGGKR